MGIEELTDEAAIEKWQSVQRTVEITRRRLGGEGSGFEVASSSSLAGDDRESSPYQVSHVIRWCMTAGVDHLHAVTQLVVTDNTLHVAAPFSLARGALETFASAFWILQPTSRDERITRALRWHAKNFMDQHGVTKNLSSTPTSDLSAKRQKLYTVADRRSLDKSLIGNGFTSSAAVQYANDHHSPDVLFAWQLCSGFAHGRPWAYLGVSDREQFATGDPGIHIVKMSSSYQTTLFPVLSAAFLLQAVIKSYNLRSGAVLDDLEFALAKQLR